MDLQAQGHAYSVEALSASFHMDLPLDDRFVSLIRQPKPPQTTVNEGGCEFRFPAISDIYLIADVTIELGLRLVTKDRPHKTVPDGALVGPVNNGERINKNCKKCKNCKMFNNYFF
jgi:hypothetical protein